MKQVMVVGDLHGNWGKLNTLINTQQPEIILQCGDFGWWPNFEVKRPVLYGTQNTWFVDGVIRQTSLMYFCDGNHEDHGCLKQDGLIHEMYDGVHHASRGSTLTLPDGRVVMFVGGADSVDKHWRTPGRDWFAEENISQSQFDRIISYEGRVDIVISHTCPDAFDIYGTEGKLKDPNRAALQLILEKYKPSMWYFGHWHKNKTGKCGDTNWMCLDYPGHGSQWWSWLR